MQLTNILAATLPLLAVVSAVPARQPEGNGQGARPTGAAPWGNTGGDNAGNPSGNTGTWMSTGQEGNSYQGGQKQQRDFDLDARALPKPAYSIRECPQSSLAQENCKDTIVIPEGQMAGGCVKSKMTTDAGASIHLLSEKFACTYFEDASCKDKHVGPYSGSQLEYTWQTFKDTWWNWRPQGMICEVITFGTPLATPKQNWQGPDLPGAA